LVFVDESFISRNPPGGGIYHVYFIRKAGIQPVRSDRDVQVAGLSMSLALAFSYDLQIPAQWL
jgi:hypothetical protein